MTRLVSMSLVMYGIKKCSGACLYCSAASTMKYRDKSGNKKTFKLDAEKTRKRILEYTEVEKFLKENPNDSMSLSIDLWGGNPVENFEEFKQTVEFCQNELKEFKYIKLHTSGNGLELQSDDIVQYLIDNDIHYQLSHDGLGQWLRTGDIDPLYWDKTKDNIVKLVKAGILDWINCTLNNYNFSFYANKDYWNKWRRENNIMEYPLYLKLNHISPGTPPIDKVYTGKDRPDTKCTKGIKNGQIIGDLTFSGKSLDTYMHEFRKFGIICMTPGIEKNLDWQPYTSYIRSQTERWEIITDEKTAGGACRQFQKGYIDKTFAVDTTGEYCQCNLVDSSTPVKDPDCTRPKECEDCEYKMQNECYSCGSEKIEKCVWQHSFCQALEEFAQLRELINVIISDQCDNCNRDNNHNCNGDGCCGDSCSCESNKNSDAIYCVKNYKV